MEIIEGIDVIHLEIIERVNGTHLAIDIGGQGQAAWIGPQL